MSVLICAAMFPEAAPVIKEFGLKMTKRNIPFDVFSNEKIHLLITGTGGVSASTAVSAATAVFGTKHLINFGVCGILTFDDTEAKTGDVFVCNKITNGDSGRDYYPDMPADFDFQEREIISFSKIYTDKNKSLKTSGLKNGVLCDMEAASIFHAGNFYMGPEDMGFIKVVSDNGKNIEKISADRVSNLTKKCIPCIREYINFFEHIDKIEKEYENIYTDKELALTEKFCRDIHATASMEEQAKSLLRYMKLSGRNIETVIKSCADAGLVPCGNKREGAKILKILKREITG